MASFNHTRRTEIPELIILLGILGVVVAFVISGVLRLRKVLASENKPTLKTYVNELGGYAVLAVILIPSGFMVLIDALRPAVPPAPAAAGPPGTETGLVRWTFSEGRYAITTPAHWQAVPGTDQFPVDLYCVDSQNDLYLIGGSIPVADLAVSEPDKLLLLIVDRIGSSFESGLERSAPVSVQIGQFAAIKCQARGTMNSVNLTYEFWMVRVGDHWVELRFWTTRSRFPNFEATFSQIASSLQQLR